MTRKLSRGARARLRAHFLNNIGRVMEAEELRHVAGNISEWARRVRELRTEEGYPDPHSQRPKRAQTGPILA